MIFILKDFTYLCEREKERAGKREHRQDRGRGGAGSLLSKEPTWGSTSGPQDHDLSRRQMLNIATQALA